jgi:hypothetical protein
LSVPGPNRLLVTPTPEKSETYAEVAHEAIFRRWQQLRYWIGAEQEFLFWKNGFEADRRCWETAPADSKSDALLMGLALVQAQSWVLTRVVDLSASDRQFIDLRFELKTRDCGQSAEGAPTAPRAAHRSGCRCADQHRPLGAVNRVRRVVYQTISDLRRKLNDSTFQHPPPWPQYGARLGGDLYLPKGLDNAGLAQWWAVMTGAF